MLLRSGVENAISRLSRYSKTQRDPIKDMVLLSARVDTSLWEYVRTLAFETRKSKQDIIAEALMLHRSVNESESLE